MIEFALLSIVAQAIFMTIGYFYYNQHVKARTLAFIRKKRVFNKALGIRGHKCRCRK